MAQNYGRGERKPPNIPSDVGPRKYIPSEEIGEYESYKKKEKKKGGLYPLNEEGEYGPPPSALPPPLPGYQRRERKPKVYASYAVSSDCEAHGDKLSRNENDRGQTYQPPPRPARRASSYTRSSPAPQRQERSFSQPRQRSNSFRHASPSPSNHDGYSGKVDWKGSLRSSECPAKPYRACSATAQPRERKTSRSSYRDSVSPNRNFSSSPDRASPDLWQKKAERRSMSSDGMSQRSSLSSTDWGYTSYNNFTASNKTPSYSNNNNSSVRSSSYSKYSSYKDSSFDESYEEDFSNSFSYNSSKSYNNSGSGGKVALASLKTPEINSWDNMGILGLSSKMFSDTSSAKQGTFSSATSGLLRRESVTSHVM